MKNEFFHQTGRDGVLRLTERGGYLRVLCPNVQDASFGLERLEQGFCGVLVRLERLLQHLYAGGCRRRLRSLCVRRLGGAQGGG